MERDLGSVLVVRSFPEQLSLVLSEAELLAVHGDLGILQEELVEGGVESTIRRSGIEGRDAILDELSEADNDGATGVGRHSG